jgi:hypothetical protein
MNIGIVLTETRHPGGFMVSEAPGRLSRDAVVIAQSQTLVAGQVLGEPTVGDGSFAAAAGVALGTNTGTGTMSTPSVGVGVQAGTYRMVASAPLRWDVFDPAGRNIGEAFDATAFAGQINFTITHSSTAFAAGDEFSVAATETDPSDAGDFVALGVSSGVTNAATSSSSAVLHFAAVPASIIAGMVVADLTTPAAIAAGTTVLSATAETVTMSEDAVGGGVLNGDSITFMAADGSENAAAISWGNYTTAAGETMEGTVIHRNAEVRGVDLTYPAGASAAQIAVINAQLLALDIVVR